MLGLFGIIAILAPFISFAVGIKVRSRRVGFALVSLLPAVMVLIGLSAGLKWDWLGILQLSLILAVIGEAINVGCWAFARSTIASAPTTSSTAPVWSDPAPPTSADAQVAPAATVTARRFNPARLIIGVLSLYVFLGLIVGANAAFSVSDDLNILGPELGSIIPNPEDRARFTALSWIARGLWLIGAVALAIGLWLWSSSGRLSGRWRRAWIGFLCLPILWFGYSVWVIEEGKAIHNKHDIAAIHVPWFVNPPIEGWTLTGYSEGEVRGDVELTLSSNGIAPSELTIPASVPVRIGLATPRDEPHKLVIDGLGIDQPVPGSTYYLDQITALVTAPPGEYRYHCGFPGHESEPGGVLRVVDAPIVAEIVYDGHRLGPDRVEIPAGKLVTIRVTNRSTEEKGPVVRFIIPDISSPLFGWGHVQFWVERGESVDLILQVPPGSWRFWGSSNQSWFIRANTGDIPGGTLVASDAIPVP